MNWKITSRVLGAALIAATAFTASDALAEASTMTGGAHNIGTAAGGAVFTDPATFSRSYSCSHSVYGQGGTYMTGYNAASAANTTYQSRSTYTAGCTAGNTSSSAGSVVTAATTLRAATKQTLGIIGTRIQQVKLAEAEGEGKPVVYGLTDSTGKGMYDQGTIGLSGGNPNKGIGVWVQGSYTWLEDKNTATNFDGNIYTIMAGADYRINKHLLVGISGGYENTSLDTKFNNGNLDASGFVVAPYLTVRLTDIFSIDATGGYAWLNYDVDRKETVSTGEKFTGEFDSTRWFAAASLNADYVAMKKIKLHGEAGYSYTREDQDAYTEKSATTSLSNRNIAANDVALGMAFLGARVGYDFGFVTPYIMVRGEYDLSKDDVAVAANQLKPKDDDFGLRVGGGLDFAIGPMFSGMMQGETVLFRDNYSEHRALAKLRLDF
jgi:hypothetical protein